MLLIGSFLSLLTSSIFPKASSSWLLLSTALTSMIAATASAETIWLAPSYLYTGLARIIHIFEDNKGLLCYKHVVKTMFAATKEASECLKITQHSVCCSQRFFASLS